MIGNLRVEMISNVTDLATTLSSCTSGLIIFTFSGANYTGTYPPKDTSFFYGGGYAIRRIDVYVGAAGFITQNPFYFENGVLTWT